MTKSVRAAVVALQIGALQVGIMLGLGSLAAHGQAIRSQTNRITNAIQNQVRQAIRPHLTVKNSAGAVVSLSLSRDGKLLLVGLQDNTLRIWDMQNGVEQNRIATGADAIALVKISADDRRAVIATAAGAIIVYDAATGTPVVRIATNLPGIAALDVNRDGSIVAAAGKDRTIRLWQAASGQEIATLRGFSADITGLALSPEGGEVAGGGADGGVRVWTTRGAATPPPLTFSAAGGVVAIGFVAADRIVTTATNGTVQVWSRANGTPQRSFRAASSAVSSEIASDGRYVAVSDAERSASVLDLDTGQKLRDLSVPAGSAKLVVVDVNQRRLLTGGADGAVRVWSLADGLNLAQIISTLNGWAVVDDKGRFDGSQQGVADVQWTANQSDLKIDDFSENYYEPGLLAKRMSDRPNFVSAAPTAVADGIYLPPRIALSAGPAPYAAGQDVEVTVTAEDQGGGVAAPRLYDNGKLVPPEALQGERTETRNGAATTIRVYRIRLVAGANELQAVAANQQQIDGEPATLALTAAGAPHLPTLHILTIGINKYRDGRFNLDYGVPDASAILKQMSRSPDGTFQRIVSYQLLDQTATRAKIAELFGALRAMPPDDVLVVYVASHGEVVGTEWYMLPYEADFSSEEAIARSSLGASALRDMLSRVGAQRVLVMIDSCKSGGSIETIAAAMDRKVLRSVAHQTGIAILAAARKDQLAAEVPTLGHGAFTYVLLAGLAGKADVNPRDGRITARKILSYSAQALPQLTKSLADYTQIPVAYNRGEDFLLQVTR